jgi:NADPH2:quinone reductase
VLAGRKARPVFPLGPFYTKCCSMHGFVMFLASAESQRRAGDQINRWLATGALHAKIDRLAPLDDAAELHRLQEQNTMQGAGVVRGKLVVNL